MKPDPGERQDAVNIPPEKPTAPPQATAVSTSQSKSPSAAVVATASMNSDSQGEEPTMATSHDNPASTTPPQQDKSDVGDDGDHNLEPAKASEDLENSPAGSKDEDDDDDEGDGSSEDDDSNEAVGKEEAAEIDRDMMSDSDESTDCESSDLTGSSGTAAGKVSVMFQRLLNMGSPTGQMVVQLSNPDDPAADGVNSEGVSQLSPAGPSASNPTTIRNGRMICNLPDHTVHAGATAIVAVIVGRTVTVANAGDSRAVLCRAGAAYPLSFDHKPLQERELTRIRNAGGFVNHFGRVNGNLNLSRSIGDLKYKQVPNIAPPDQIITAEPDIVQ